MKKPLLLARLGRRSAGTPGFTLLELLVVIAIIALLAALLVPALKTARDKARAAQCSSNMKQFGMAFQMYADQNSGWLPNNWFDDSYNWESMLVDNPQGGNYFGSQNDLRSRNPVGPVIRVSTRLLCPTTVAHCITGPLGQVVQLSDPHNQWGYSYNHLRGSISWQANGWPWSNTALLGVDTRVLYQTPSKYIIMADGNGANWNPDDWDATTGDLSSYNYPIQPVHGSGVNALFLDGHVQYMSLSLPGDIATFNQAYYGGIPIAGNPYLNY